MADEDASRFLCESCKTPVRWVSRDPVGDLTVLGGVCGCPGAMWVSTVDRDDPRPRRATLVVARHDVQKS